MWLYLILLFVFLPWTELMLLLKLNSLVGWLDTLAIVLITGMVGAALARREGLRAVTRVKAAFSEGKLPTTELVDAVIVFAAGLLLITPGFITDTVGFLAMVPPVRAVFRKRIMAAAKAHVRVVGRPTGNAERRHGESDDAVIDVSAIVLDEDDQR